MTAWMDRRIKDGQNAVVACSALKRSYRDALRRGRPDVRMVLLEADPAALRARLQARHGHFFPATLLESQLAALEPAGPGEPVVTVPATADPAAVTADIMHRLGCAEPVPR